MKVDIIRVEEGSEGTFGVLRLDGFAFCVTLEPPDLDNRANVSNIPPGTYRAVRVKSPRYGETYEITGVPGRSHILFHAGNVVEHTKGCVLLGQYFGKLKGDRAVLNSGVTFAQFLAAVGGVPAFTVNVLEVPPC